MIIKPAHDEQACWSVLKYEAVLNGKQTMRGDIGVQAIIPDLTRARLTRAASLT